MAGVGSISTLNAHARSAPAPSLPRMFSRYKEGLEEELRAAVSNFPDGTVSEEGPSGPSVNVVGEHPAPSLGDMLQYHMGWMNQDGEPPLVPIPQGKALRPTLCLFVCEALSGDWTPGLPAAAALELIHNFSLIHDDIQDGDLERRHRPTVWSLWGQPQALVAGNAMRSIADRTALELTARGVTPSTALRVSCVLTRSYLDMTRGQCMDLAFEGRLDIRLDNYLEMVSRKTGALIRCAVEMGAVVGCDDDKTVGAFARCGSTLGRAFQIKDDVLGIWGDEGATGKPVGNDIRRKKKSFPIVYALETANGATRQLLVDIYNKARLDDRDVEDVLGVLEELDVLGYAGRVTQQQAGLALEQARRVPMSPRAFEEMEGLVQFLVQRES